MIDKPLTLNKKIITICILVPVCLSCIKYFGDIHFTRDFLYSSGLKGLSASLDKAISESSNPELSRLTWWVSVLFFFYFVVPCIVVFFFFREHIREYGLRIAISRKDGFIYLLMLLFMIPLIYAFSTTESFQARYPFYISLPGESLYPNFFKWELLYLVQFFALEFFFRGFMLHGLKKEFGLYSILIMSIPYCMIHFGKPFPETLSAIAAGIALGYMSFKSGSIIPGAILHFCVGFGMDAAALYQKGYFGG